MQPTDDATFRNGATPNIPIQEFFSRPHEVDNFEWEVGTNLDRVIDPWSLFLGDPNVAAKLSTFAYARFNMKIRFQINGTPFHYGQLNACYVPYGKEGNALFSHLWDTVRLAGGEGREANMSYLSTLPNIIMNPADNSVVEMSIPLVWHNNWLRLDGGDLISPGKFYLLDFAPLRRASDDAADHVHVTAMVWAEDMELAGATVATSSTSNINTADEYDDSGPISSVAASVAQGAGMLSSAPAIGKYARATEIGAGAMADIAKIFGFSSPAQLKSTDYFKEQPFRNFANTQGTDTACKLSYDPKQEVTVDSRVVGLNEGEDQMTFDNIIDREMFLVASPWTPVTTGGAPSHGPIAADPGLIFNANVSPMMYKRVQTPSLWQPHPGSMIGRAFNVWNGSVTFRFEVIASKFHSGRLVVSFDPMSNSNVYDFNNRMTRTIDLSSTRELEFKIDFISNSPYKELQDLKETFSPLSTAATTNTSAGNFNEDEHIGYIQVRIANDLVAPNNQEAFVMCYFKVNEGMEYAMPSDRFRDDLYLPTSSSTEIVTADEDSKRPVEPICNELVTSTPALDRNKVFFGERVTSLRSLLHRTTLALTEYINVGDDGMTALSRYVHPYYPSIHTASTHARWKACYENYFAPAFLCKRGGARWRYVNKVNYPNIDNRSNDPGDNYMWASREWDATGPPTYGDTYTYVSQAVLEQFAETGLKGAIVTYVQNNAGLEADYPYYNPTRFSLTQVIDGVQNPTEMGSQSCKLSTIGAWLQKRSVLGYFSTSEDYSLHFFMAAPPIYIV